MRTFACCTLKEEDERELELGDDSEDSFKEDPDLDVDGKDGAIIRVNSEEGVAKSEGDIRKKTSEKSSEKAGKDDVEDANQAVLKQKDLRPQSMEGLIDPEV